MKAFQLNEQVMNIPLVDNLIFLLIRPKKSEADAPDIF